MRRVRSDRSESMINDNNEMLLSFGRRASSVFFFLFLRLILQIYRCMFRMKKNESSSIPMRPTINIQQDSHDFSGEMLKSPSNHVSMDVSNVITPYQAKIPPQQQNEKRTKKWSIDDFNIGRRLGEGSYSTVILVEEKKTGFLCALKVIKVEKNLTNFHPKFSPLPLEIHYSTISTRTSVDSRIGNSHASLP